MTEAVPTIFLDRDGVINVPTGIPHAYVTSWKEFHFLPGVAEAIRTLNGLGYRVVVATNQRGIARGALTRLELDRIHDRMLAVLENDGAHIDKVYVCPHEGGCACRKPEPGLLVQADADCPAEKAKSFMVGDSDSDIEAGRRFGVRTVRIAARDGDACDNDETIQADYQFADLLGFATALRKGEIA